MGFARADHVLNMCSHFCQLSETKLGMALVSSVVSLTLERPLTLQTESCFTTDYCRMV